MKVVVNDSLIPKSQDAPLDYRGRIISDDGTIENIKQKIIELGNPYVGQIVYDKAFDKYWYVTGITMDTNLNVDITIKPFGVEIEVATEQDIINIFN